MNTLIARLRELESDTRITAENFPELAHLIPDSLRAYVEVSFEGASSEITFMRAYDGVYLDSLWFGDEENPTDIEFAAAFGRVLTQALHNAGNWPYRSKVGVA